MRIAILGAGNVGRHLHQLLSAAGQDVHLCAREATPERPCYAEGVAQADIVLLAIPYLALAEVLPALAENLRGKVVVDCTNPLNPDWSPLLLGQENSAGEEVARLLPASRVVKAFNTIFADVMSNERLSRSGQRVTAFVAGDDAHAKAAVMALAKAAGMEPLDVGPLRTARHLEAMAHLNIQIAVGQGGGTNAAFVYHQVK
jgi:8-hydroxy-5-deazaflavin:NADPH oxidoreductase